MRQAYGKGTLCALGCVGWLLAAGSAAAQQAPGSRSDQASRIKEGKVSGVIVKVDDVRRGEADRDSGKSGAAKCVTINTAAVWRDWVRDQARVKTDVNPKSAAREGGNSIATKGEPKSPDTLVKVEVCADTKIDTRYRSATDATGAGAKTPAAAAEAEKDRRDTSQGNRPDLRSRPGGPKFTLADLKPGLFVQVEFRPDQKERPASCLSVLRPVGGADIPAKDAAPPGSK